MFKHFLAAILLIGSFSHAYEGDQYEYEYFEDNLDDFWEDDEEDLTESYFAEGLANIIYRDYLTALEKLELAEALEDAQEDDYMLVIQFLKAIAYDNLGMAAECQLALEIASCKVNEIEWEFEDLESLQNFKVMIRFFRGVASFTNSPEVWQNLTSMLDEIESKSYVNDASKRNTRWDLGFFKK